MLFVLELQTSDLSC